MCDLFNNKNFVDMLSIISITATKADFVNLNDSCYISS